MNAISSPTPSTSGASTRIEEATASQQTSQDGLHISVRVDICSTVSLADGHDSIPAGASLEVSQPSEDDDEPPPLASDLDSDADEGGDNGGHDSDDSIPSLQSVSDSSDSDTSIASDSEESVWNDDGDLHEELQNVIVTVSRISENPLANVPHWQDEDVDEEDEEDEEDDEDTDDWVDEDMPHNGFTIPLDRHLTPQELVDLLLTPRRMSVDNDPLRAETLLEGFEAVSHELVRRYEKLRCGHGDGGEGCAICRDDFIQEEPENPQDHNLVISFAALPFHPPPSLVLAFPCPGRHLFHSSCLAPWLSRKTTCPSCRFDIDPNSLTLRLTGSTTSRYMDASGRAWPPRVWEPPQMCSLAQWLEQEEQTRESGPSVVHSKKTPESALSAQIETSPHAHEEREDGGEDEQHGWIDTDSESDDEDSAPRMDAMHAGSRQSSASRTHRVTAALLAVGAASRTSARDLHDAVFDDVFRRALRMGRSSIGGPYDLAHHPHHNFGPDSGADQPSLD